MPESNTAECADENRLFLELKRTLGSLVEIQHSHLEALASGYSKESRFEEEISIALSAWQDARHAYVLHVSNHGCRSSQNLI
jgi:hypothetical protein